LRGIRQRQRQVSRQIQRLVDADAAALTLDELRTRRRCLEEHLATLRQEEQRLAAEATRAEQGPAVAARLEDFRAAIVSGLERASQEERRALVGFSLTASWSMLPLWRFARFSRSPV
jgi:hypothetical protein